MRILILIDFGASPPTQRERPVVFTTAWDACKTRGQACSPQNMGCQQLILVADFTLPHIEPAHKTFFRGLNSSALLFTEERLYPVTTNSSDHRERQPESVQVHRLWMTMAPWKCSEKIVCVVRLVRMLLLMGENSVGHQLASNRKGRWHSTRPHSAIGPSSLSERPVPIFLSDMFR